MAEETASLIVKLIPDTREIDAAIARIRQTAGGAGTPGAPAGAAAGVGRGAAAGVLAGGAIAAGMNQFGFAGGQLTVMGNMLRSLQLIETGMTSFITAKAFPFMQQMTGAGFPKNAWGFASEQLNIAMSGHARQSAQAQQGQPGGRPVAVNVAQVAGQPVQNNQDDAQQGGGGWMAALGGGALVKSLARFGPAAAVAAVFSAAGDMAATMASKGVFQGDEGKSTMDWYLGRKAGRLAEFTYSLNSLPVIRQLNDLIFGDEGVSAAEAKARRAQTQQNLMWSVMNETRNNMLTGTSALMYSNNPAMMRVERLEQERQQRMFDLAYQRKHGELGEAPYQILRQSTNQLAMDQLMGMSAQIYGGLSATSGPLADLVTGVSSDLTADPAVALARISELLEQIRNNTAREPLLPDERQ